MGTEHRIDLVQKIVRTFFKDEVKTPLAFFFKLPWTVPAIVVGVMLASGSDSLKFKIILLGLCVIVGFAVLVAALAWFKPKHLVYGETGHRAELKMEMGTEQRALSASAASDLTGQPMPVERRLDG